MKPAPANESACPRPRVACVYLLGGHHGARVEATVEAYDTAANTWLVAPRMPTPLSMPAAVTAECPRSDDQCIYVLGGRLADGLATGAVSAYDPSTSHWISSETGG